MLATKHILSSDQDLMRSIPQTHLAPSRRSSQSSKPIAVISLQNHIKKIDRISVEHNMMIFHVQNKNAVETICHNPRNKTEWLLIHETKSEKRGWIETYSQTDLKIKVTNDLFSFLWIVISQFF